MTKEEAWVYVVEQFLTGIENEYAEKAIVHCLEEAGGNISQATNMLPISIALRGFSGPDTPRAECWGSIPRTVISVWMPDNSQKWEGDPDFVIKWREVVEYVKNGKKRVYQPVLFQELTL